MPTGCINNFPQRGVAGHMAPYVKYLIPYNAPPLKKFPDPKLIFGIRLNTFSKLLELGSSNLVHSFVFEKPSGRGKKFPEKGRDVVT